MTFLVYFFYPIIDTRITNDYNAIMIPKKVGLLIIILFVSILLLNYFFSKMLNEPEPTKPPVVQPRVAAVANSNKYAGQEIIERIHLDPNRIYQESVFWVDGQEIGRFKFEGDKIYDASGDLPDGQVRFVNETTETFGKKFYRNGQRHGEYLEYYKGGEKKREAMYEAGRIIRNKEYFIDGTLRLEEDFEDALLISKSKEVGAGKAYYRDGTLMYEWNITNRNRERFTKSYNIKGELVEARLYDETGALLKIEKLNSPPLVEPDQTR